VKLPALNYLASSGCFVGSDSKVTEMNWDPADIVGVVQSKEPGDTFCQSIEVHAEGGLPLGPVYTAAIITILLLPNTGIEGSSLSSLSTIHQTPKL